MSLDMLTVKAPAKLNFALGIKGVDGRGYHLLEMVMQTIDLYDVISVTKTGDRKITLSCNDDCVPCDETNICYRCVSHLQAVYGVTSGVKIHIEKNIPMQAGMAGGSADGAGTLAAMNRLFKLGLSPAQLCEIGKGIGADIPFCITGGTAKVEGIGEIITRLSDMPKMDIVVAKPGGGINTGRAFDMYDRLEQKPAYRMDRLLDAIQVGNMTGIAGNLFNSLELVADLADIGSIKNMMLRAGANGALMTGSGSAVFGIFTDRSKALSCEKRLRQKYRQVFLCNPVSHGVVIV